MLRKRFAITGLFIGVLASSVLPGWAKKEPSHGSSSAPSAALSTPSAALSTPTAARSTSAAAHSSPAAHPLSASSKTAAPAAAASPAPAGPSASPASAQTLPDYGGRDSAAGAAYESSAGGDAPNPLAQAWRAFEALAIVLALVFGGLYLLKRFGGFGAAAPFGKNSPSAAIGALVGRRLAESANSAAPSPFSDSAAIQLIGAQPLPGSQGASVHLLTVADRTFLVGATSQSVTLMSEWRTDEPLEPNVSEPSERDFHDYLVRAGGAPNPLKEGVVETRVSEANHRLREMLERVRDESDKTWTGSRES